MITHRLVMMTSALMLAMSLIGCDSSARQVAPSKGALDAPPRSTTPPAATTTPNESTTPSSAEAEPEQVTPDAQAAIKALKLMGPVEHKLMRLNAHVELILLERELERQTRDPDGEMSAELRKEAWLVHKEDGEFKVLAHTDHGECEDYELTLTLVEALASLSLFTVGCANGEDYWRSARHITLLYHGDKGVSPTSIWSQTLHDSNELGQCIHESSLSVTQQGQQLHIKVEHKAIWDGTGPLGDDDPEVNEASCKRDLKPSKTEKIELKP